MSIQLERKCSRAEHVEYHAPLGDQDPGMSGNGDAVKLTIQEVSRSKKDNLQEWIYLIQVIDRLMLLFYVVAVSVMFVIKFTLK